MKHHRIIRSITFLIIIMSSFGFIRSKTEMESLSWYDNFDQAMEKAKSLDKFVLMSFSGSDWCANCMRLEKVLFESEVFQKFSAEELVLLKLDFPAKKKNKLPADQQKHNDELAKKYNAKGAFPTVILLNSEGVVLGQMDHPLQGAEAYIENIKKILQR